jgi:hypothetical protein
MPAVHDPSRLKAELIGLFAEGLEMDRFGAALPTLKVVPDAVAEVLPAVSVTFPAGSETPTLPLAAAQPVMLIVRVVRSVPLTVATQPVLLPVKLISLA